MPRGQRTLSDADIAAWVTTSARRGQQRRRSQHGEVTPCAESNMRRAVGWLCSARTSFAMAFAVAACSMAPSHKLVATPPTVSRRVVPTRCGRHERERPGRSRRPISNCLPSRIDRQPASKRRSGTSINLRRPGYFQPFLLRRKSRNYHRDLGDASTPVVPLQAALLTIFAVLPRPLARMRQIFRHPIRHASQARRASYACYSQQELQRIVTLLSGIWVERRRLRKCFRLLYAAVYAAQPRGAGGMPMRIVASTNARTFSQRIVFGPAVGSTNALAVKIARKWIDPDGRRRAKRTSSVSESCPRSSGCAAQVP